MATEAQNTANCANAQLSTGPKTDAGKQAVAQNGLRHGLSTNKFAVLPNENAAEYNDLLASLQAEFSPRTAAQSFLVEEMARAQWKLRRVTAMEHELLSGAGDLTQWFKEDCSKDQVLLKLGRYESAARRAWYKALGELRKFQQAKQIASEQELEETLEALINAPMPGNYKANPIPPAPAPQRVPQAGRPAALGGPQRPFTPPPILR